MSPRGATSIWGLVPVKPLMQAKSRLAPVLAPAERRMLQAAMLGDVLSALRASPALAGFMVVTADPAAAAIAAAHGGAAHGDTARGLDGALDAALPALAALGASHAMIVPADLPLLDPADIARLAEDARGGQAIVVPDRHGTGTNGLLVPVSCRGRFAFGLMSYARHAACLPGQGARLTSFALDIDTPDDLAELRCRRPAGATGAFLARLSLPLHESVT